MLLTPHTIVGIAIGATVPNPYLAVPLSFLAHFAGDTIPHWDFFSNSKKEDRVVGWRPLAVMADMSLGIAVGLTFTLYAFWVSQNPNLAANIFLSGLASVLPDVLESPYIYMKKEPKYLGLLTKIHRRMQFQLALPWGIITQIVVVLVCLLPILSSVK